MRPEHRDRWQGTVPWQGGLPTEQWKDIDSTLYERRTLVLTAMGGVILATLAAYWGIFQSQSQAPNPCEQFANFIVGSCTWQRYSFDSFPLLLCLALEAFCVAYLWRLSRIKGEADYGQPVRVNGQIAWKGGKRRGRYVPVAPGKPIRVLTTLAGTGLFSGSLQSPPGNYQLSYLPRTRVLAGIEWLDGAEMAGPGTLEALSQVFDFSEADTELNRAGQLSQRQRSRLRRAIGLGAVQWAGAALAFVGWLALFPDLYLNLFTEDTSGKVLAGVFAVVAAVVAFCVWALLAFWCGMPAERRTIRADLRAGTVAMAQGTGSKSVVERTVKVNNAKAIIHTYAYSVAGARFRLPSRAAYNACLNGMSCRVFYAPVSKRLLSFEGVVFPALGPGATTLGDT